MQRTVSEMLCRSVILHKYLIIAGTIDYEIYTVYSTLQICSMFIIRPVLKNMKYAMYMDNSDI